MSSYAPSHSQHVTIAEPVHEASRTSVSAPPPPPPPTNDTTNWSQLPPGWSTAISPHDGRIYYWEQATGRTSWNHPLAPPVASTSDFPPNGPLGRLGKFFGGPASRSMAMPLNPNDIYDTPRNARSRPDNHQCYAMAALVLCPPVGIFAMFQSIMVDRSWSQGYYGDAVNHSRQASQYACFGTFIGVIFWVWYFFFDRILRMRDWFRFD